MSVVEALLVVAGAGAVGGVLAALLSEDKGFVFPRRVAGEHGTVTYRPGFLGLILVGGAAAALSFALYGPLANATVIGGPETPIGAEGEAYGITLAALGGAVLVGIGGSKWLASQVDKVTLQHAAVTAAKGVADAAHARTIADATPSQALEAALDMTQPPGQAAAPVAVAAPAPHPGLRVLGGLVHRMRHRPLG